MAASALPTAHHEPTPPKIVSRPLVPQSAHEVKPGDEPQALMFGSQTPKPTIRFASETEVAEALGPGAVAEPKTGAEPVAETPVQRPSFPVSSYYETARRQAWHELPRVEPTPPLADDLEHSSASHTEEVEEPKVAASSEVATAPVPVVVEHIPQAAEHAPAEEVSAAEQVPGRASVFDDEFFRKPKLDEAEAKLDEDPASKSWPDARVPSFAGYATEPTGENDELDIPAFLRRKQ